MGLNLEHLNDRVWYAALTQRAEPETTFDKRFNLASVNHNNFNGADPHAIF